MKALKEQECFVWQTYNKTLESRVLEPVCAGFIEESVSSDRYLAKGFEGSVEEGNFIVMYILIDKEDHLIADAKYQAFGETPLIAAAEKACDLLIRKTVHQAKRLSGDLIESSFKENAKQESFPKSCFEHINHVISAIDHALMNLPEEILGFSELKTPIEAKNTGGQVVYPEFFSLSKQERLKIISDVLKEDIIPYIELDEGGAEVKDIINEKEVLLSYSGTCTSCYSAIGTTLSAIEQTLQDKIHPDLIVTPDMESLNF